MAKLHTSKASARHRQRHLRVSSRTSRRRGRIRATPITSRCGDRRTMLARALQVWPHELEDTPQARLQIVRKLERTLRAERRRGTAGHWTYDLARHAELLRLYREEVARLPLPERIATRRRRG
jgi:hypothetical protein